MTIGYVGTDWEQSADPYVDRQFNISELWPQGAGSDSAGGDKGALEAGDHPILAIGAVKTYEKETPVGVVVTVTEERAVVNIGRGFITRQNIANVLTYAAGVPDTFKTSVEIGDHVYVDDSAGLDGAVCLSFSPLNADDETNPFAGTITRIQTEYDDTFVGGAEASRDFPVTVEGTLTNTVFAVMLK